MPGRKIIALLVAVAALCGCATSYAPSGALPEPGEVANTHYGAWVYVEFTNANGSRQTAGELIAVGADSLYLAPNVGLVAIAKPDITLAQAELYDASRSAITAMTVLGTISTASHGFFLIFSAPIWILAGSASGAGHSREPIVKYPDQSFSRFADLARFPAGLPAGIDRARLSSGLPAGSDVQTTSPESSPALFR